VEKTLRAGHIFTPAKKRFEPALISNSGPNQARGETMFHVEHWPWFNRRVAVFHVEHHPSNPGF
jgi:hypothetical protein